jgi:hypothetical protein
MYLQADEMYLIHTFFEGFNLILSGKLEPPSAKYETDLTSALSSMFHQPDSVNLPYRLDELNTDLSALGLGRRLAIELRMHEYTTRGESSETYSDLGLIVEIIDPDEKEIMTKAFLLQAKRLHFASESRTYRLNSGYKGFDHDQFQQLNELQDEIQGDGIGYLLYNPVIKDFEIKEQDLIRELEIASFPYALFWNHPFTFIPPSSAGKALNLVRQRHSAIVDVAGRFHRLMTIMGQKEPFEISTDSLRPGIKVLGLSSLNDMLGITGKKSFDIRDCYNYAASNGRWIRLNGLPFVPFASFIVDFLLGCVSGSPHPGLLNLCGGKSLVNGSDEAPDRWSKNLKAKYSLKITIRSARAEEPLFRSDSDHENRHYA